MNRINLHLFCFYKSEVFFVCQAKKCFLLQLVSYRFRGVTAVVIVGVSLIILVGRQSVNNIICRPIPKMKKKSY